MVSCGTRRALVVECKVLVCSPKRCLDKFFAPIGPLLHVALLGSKSCCSFTTATQVSNLSEIHFLVRRRSMELVRCPGQQSDAAWQHSWNAGLTRHSKTNVSVTEKHSVMSPHDFVACPFSSCRSFSNSKVCICESGRCTVVLFNISRRLWEVFLDRGSGARNTRRRRSQWEY